MRQIRSSSPTTAISASRGPGRLAGLGLTIGLALSLTACSDDGLSLPSGDQLKQFVSDAQSQIDTISSDVADLAGQLGKLPETVRATTQDAVDKSREATTKAQSALEDAKNSKDGAEKSLETARGDIEDAKTRISAALDQLKNKTDSGSEEARKGLEDLRAQLNDLQDDVTP